ncbi:MAG: heparinase II/III family protein [Phycisphaerae bacterium]|nr:heparinase II/III family protein [Phycisphaerae bacterium]
MGTDDVELIVSMSEDEIRSLVPPQSVLPYCGCPNPGCANYGGSERGFDIFTWDPNWAPDIRAEKVQCRTCAQFFPNSQYEFNGWDEFPNPFDGNKKVKIGYYSAKGRRHYFGGLNWFFRKTWLVGCAWDLAKRYRNEGRSEEFARRVVWIMDGFARAYPSYCVVEQNAAGSPDVTRGYKPKATTPPGTRWSFWEFLEVPRSLPVAYRNIKGCKALDDQATRKRIENDLFRGAVDYIVKYLWETDSRKFHNAMPYVVLGLVRIGIGIGEPAYVHRACAWVRDMLEFFHFDGMWPEGPGYHYQTVSLIKDIVTELTGYTDPDSYKGTPEDPRFDHLDPMAELRFWPTALQAPDVIAYPDGATCPVHNTFVKRAAWAENGMPSPVRHQGTCRLLPGFGHAVLGAGSGDATTEVHLHFSGTTTAHAHGDNLNLALFSRGREMICDMGYTHTKYNHWTVSTIGHNLVAVDEACQARHYDPDKPRTDGDLLMFVPGLPGLAVMEARGKLGYDVAGHTLDIYRRMVILVSIDPEHPYIVDVFHVKGGQKHDWLMHGSADHDQIASCSLGLAAMTRKRPLLEPAEEKSWREPQTEFDEFDCYGLMQDVKEGSSHDNCSFTFKYVDWPIRMVANDGETKVEDGDQPPPGTQITLLGGTETQYYLCTTPSVRRALGDDRQLGKFFMPQIVARRVVDASLDSIFVAVIEPFRGQPRIKSVERIPTKANKGRSVGLQVNVGDRADTVIVSLLEDDSGTAHVTTEDGSNVVLKGRLGMLTQGRRRALAGYLVAGTEFSTDGMQILSEMPFYEGEIDEARRIADGNVANAFLTSAKLPIGTELAGSWMIVTHGNGHTHAYEIDHVGREKAQTWIHVRQDHGLRVDPNSGTTDELYWPKRTKIKGQHTFRIYCAATGQPSSGRPLEQPSMGSTQVGGEFTTGGGDSMTKG